MVKNQTVFTRKIGGLKRPGRGGYARLIEEVKQLPYEREVFFVGLLVILTEEELIGLGLKKFHITALKFWLCHNGLELGMCIPEDAKAAVEKKAAELDERPP